MLKILFCWHHYIKVHDSQTQKQSGQYSYVSIYSMYDCIQRYVLNEMQLNMYL